MNGLDFDKPDTSCGSDENVVAPTSGIGANFERGGAGIAVVGKNGKKQGKQTRLGYYSVSSMEQFIVEEEEMKNRFKTGNDDRSVRAHGIEWSVHARGGDLIQTDAAALGVLDPTVLDVNVASSAVALDSRIENDRSLRVDCDATDSIVNV